MLEKIITLSILYFVQGLPYGFQDKFIPMYLRSQGLSHTRLSLMKLLLLPWLCKALFAPLIDLYWTKWHWLVFSLCSLVVVSFLGIFITIDHFVLMSFWLLFLNLFSAFQDVSVDALAMHILQECEIGHCNTAQVVGYKLGALFGGGILFWIHFYHGWGYLCFSLGIFYAMSIIAFIYLYWKNSFNSEIINKHKDVPSLTKEKNEELIIKTERSLSIEELPRNLILRRRLSDISNDTLSDNDKTKEKLQIYNIWEILKLIFMTNGTISAIVFLLLYKLGERGALSTFPIFLIDQGISPKDIGIWSGILGQLSSLLGSVCAGWFIAEKGNLKVFLHYVLLLRCIPIFVMWLIIKLWHSDVSGIYYFFLFCFSVLCLISLEFAAGLVTTSIFTLMMSCSLKAPASLQATHYSILSSVEIAGKLLFASFIGALIDWIGLSEVYGILLMLSASSIILVEFVN